MPGWVHPTSGTHSGSSLAGYRFARRTRQRFHAGRVHPEAELTDTDVGFDGPVHLGSVTCVAVNRCGVGFPGRFIIPVGSPAYIGGITCKSLADFAIRVPNCLGADPSKPDRHSDPLHQGGGSCLACIYSNRNRVGCVRVG